MGKFVPLRLHSFPTGYYVSTGVYVYQVINPDYVVQTEQFLESLRLLTTAVMFVASERYLGVSVVS